MVISKKRLMATPVIAWPVNRLDAKYATQKVVLSCLKGLDR
jgi:hypothetical protein